MKQKLKIYDEVKLIQESEASRGMIVEAMPKSPATGDIFIPTINIEPTGVFGYIVGNVVKENYRLSDCKMGVPILERILFDKETEIGKKEPILMSFQEWTNKQGLCKLIGKVFINEQDVNRVDKKHFDYLEREAIVLSYENREYISKSLLEFRKQRGKKVYIFVGDDGKKYNLSEMKFCLG